MDHSDHELIVVLEALYHEAVERWTCAVAEMCSRSTHEFWDESEKVRRLRIEAQSLRYQIEELKRRTSN